MSVSNVPCALHGMVHKKLSELINTARDKSHQNARMKLMGNSDDSLHGMQILETCLRVLAEYVIKLCNNW